MIPARRLPVPVLTRYVLAEFSRLFGLLLAGFATIYIIVDAFDRLSFFLRYNATFSEAARYLAFKLPLIVTQVTPPAVLAATLLCLALLGRRNEILAMQASGVSLARIARPLIAAAGLISVATFVWNETIVPASTHRSERVNLVEIRKQAPRTLLSDREIWYRGSDGFYNIDHVDREQQALYGIAIYGLDGDFQLVSTTVIASARWAGDHWEISGARRRRITETGEVKIERVDPGSVLRSETIADFLEAYREPEELSYATLRSRLQALKRKGIDTTSFQVDLHLKLAVPFASLLLCALAIPIAGRPQRRTSVALVTSLGVVIGFCYWLILAFAVSLGHGGALPPAAAAWAANGIAGLAAAILFLERD